MRWLWLAAAVLLIAAAVSVYAAFQRPDFVAGLTAAAAGALRMELFNLQESLDTTKRLVIRIGG